MTLIPILFLPVIGGIIAWFSGETNRTRGRNAMLLALVIDVLLLFLMAGVRGAPASEGGWIAQQSISWLPQLGIRFALALDGLSLSMALLTCVVGIAVVLTLDPKRANPGLYALLLMSLISSMLGVFFAEDLSLFFVCYEVMLLPAYGLVVLWGSGDSRRAATRFFIFTQAGGLLMLVAIAGLHVAHYRASGVHTFMYTELLNTPIAPMVATFFLTCFFLAFAVKLPLVPFHTWQPDAYASAPVEASILFSAVMAKTAGYGLLRFAVPLFHDAAVQAAPYAMALGVVTILYASWMAYGQTDLKRIIAYSSAGHLGYVVLGAFALNTIGTQGAIVQMVCHGISVTGLFLLANVIEQRTGTRNIEQLGGLWKSAPRLGSVTLIFALATLGLPGLGNFVGEFLVLLGAFESHPIIAAVAVLGTLLAAAYSLRLMQRVFFGPATGPVVTSDLDARTFAVTAGLIALLIWFGLYPRPLLNAAELATGRPNQIVIVSAENLPKETHP